LSFKDKAIHAVYESIAQHTFCALKNILSKKAKNADFLENKRTLYNHAQDPRDLAEPKSESKH
jgi:hypothetical protein